MSMTQDEYERSMTEICAKHTNEVIYLVNLSVLASQLCPTLGHEMHLLIAECVRCYCNEHGITLEQLRDAGKDLDRLSETIRIMSAMPEETLQPSNFCNQLLNKFR